MKKIYFLFCFFVSTFVLQLQAQNEFITEWYSRDGSITIPTSSGLTLLGETSSYSYNYNIVWIDKQTNVVLGSANNVTGDFTINNLPVAPITVKISGTFPHFYMNYGASYQELTHIVQWGNMAWKSFEASFYGCINLLTATWIPPDLSQVKNMSLIFREASKFDADLSQWNVSKVENMSEAFKGATVFNGDITGWNVSSVKDMSQMFYEAKNFDKNLAIWNVMNVENMSFMFAYAEKFNGNIIGWNVGRVKSMAGMFREAKVFNRDLSNWNVSAVTNMSHMFREAFAFNFNLSKWDISNVTQMEMIFVGNGMSYCNIDTTLNAWAPVLSVKTYSVGQVPQASTNSQAIRNTLGARVSVSNLINNPISNSITILSTNQHCLGEQITLTTTGGAISKWNNTLQNTSISFELTHDTIITVEGTDSYNCKGYDTLNILVFTPPSVSLTSDAVNNEACFNSLVELTASGADVYEWNGNAGANTTTFTIQNDTTFILKGTDVNGCSAYDTLIMNVLALPIVEINTTQSTCLGENVTFTASGADSYLWEDLSTNASTTFSLESDTTLIVQGTDANGCTANDTLNITVHSLPIVEIHAIPAASKVCPGETVNIYATGADAYLWNTGETTAGIYVINVNLSTYSVEGTDLNGCKSNEQIQIDVFEIPAVNIVATAAEVCKGKSTTLTAQGEDLVSFEWDSGEQTASITVSPEVETTYIAVVTDINGCVNKKSITIAVKECVGMDENSISYAVYPNPVTDFVNIQIQNIDVENTRISIVDIAGKTIANTIANSENTTLSVANYPSGIYFVKIQSGKNVHVEKIIKY